jgi:ABC-type antimicrobial peptide transport system permease subunit
MTDALRRLMPSVPLYAARPMTNIVSSARARTSFLLVLFGIASTLALALGAVGLFGISAYLVTLRGREMAIRLALGARPLDVRRMITRQGITLAVIGVVVGLGGAIAATRALAALLFGVSPGDPVTLAAAAALMIVVSAAANWLPAHRAGRIDPAQALRAE